MAARVFVSYARLDGEQAAADLTERLRDAAPDLDVWRDRANLEGGRGWWTQIADAIDRSNFLLLVMTPAAFESAIVRREWQYARQQGVCVYPVLSHRVRGAFNSLPRWMRKAHFHDLTAEWDTLLAHLRQPCQAVRVPFMAADRPPRYVERATELDRARRALLGDDPGRPPGGVVLLHGPGGFGKTTLATAVCHDEAVQAAFDDGVLWTTLGEHASVSESISTLYRGLTGEPVSFADAREGARRLAEKLAHRNCLIVIDDVWSPDDLAPFPFGNDGCTWLVTSRRSDLDLDARAVAVEEMETREARQLLAMAFGDAAPPISRLDQIARRLGEWPLLLELMASALRLRVARGDSAEKALEVLEARLAEGGIVAFDRRDSDARERAVSRTLDVSLQLLDPLERTSLEELSVFPGDVNVPISAAERLWGTGTVATEERFERLANLALVQVDLGAETFLMHDVIRAYVAARLQTPAAVHARLLDAWGDAMTLPDAYAWQWYVHHATAAGRPDVVHARLFDGGWLSRRLTFGGLARLIEDYTRVPDPDGRTVADALRLSSHVLAIDPSQVAPQLLGRLPSQKDATLDALVAQAVRSLTTPWLRPLQPTLATARGPLRRTLAAEDRVSALAVSADGARAVTATREGLFTTWDLTTGECVRRAHAPGPAPKDGWYYIVIPGSGRRAALAPFFSAPPSGLREKGAAGSLLVLDLETDPPREILRWTGDVRDLSLSPDEQLVVAATAEPAVRAWSIDDGAERFAADIDTLHVSASNDACRLIWNSGGKVLLQDYCDGMPPPVAPDPPFTMFPLQTRLSEAGDRLIAHGIGELEAWDIPRGRRLARFESVATGPIAATPDASRVIAGAMLDGGVRILDILHERTLLQLPTERVTAVAISADGGTALAAHVGVVRVLAVDAGAHEPADALTGAVDAVLARPGARNAAVSTTEGEILVWSKDGAGARLRFEHGITALAIAEDDDVVVATSDGQLAIWTPEAGTRGPVPAGGTVTAIAPIAGGTIAIGLTDGTMRRLEAATGTTLDSIGIAVPSASFESHVAVAPLVALGNGALVVGSLEDMPDFGKTMRKLTVWDPLSEAARELDAIFVYGPPPVLVAATSARSFVATLSEGALGTWRFDDDGLVAGPTIDLGTVTALCATPDGRVIAGTRAGDVHLWDPAAPSTRMLGTHAGEITAVALSPDGTRCVAASTAGVLGVHTIADGALLGRFHADSALTGCAWLDDATIVAGERLGRVHVLSVELP